MFLPDVDISRLSLLELATHVKSMRLVVVNAVALVEICFASLDIFNSPECFLHLCELCPLEQNMIDVTFFFSQNRSRKLGHLCSPYCRLYSFWLRMLISLLEWSGWGGLWSSRELFRRERCIIPNSWVVVHHHLLLLLLLLEMLVDLKINHFVNKTNYISRIVI